MADDERTVRDEARSLMREALTKYGEVDRELTEAVLSRLPLEALPDAAATTYSIVYLPEARCLSASYPQDVRMVATADYDSELLALFRSIKETGRSEEARAAVDRYIEYMTGDDAGDFYRAFVGAFALEMVVGLLETLASLRKLLLDFLARPLVGCLAEGVERYFEQLDRALLTGDLSFEVEPTDLESGPACYNYNQSVQALTELWEAIRAFDRDPIAILKAKAPVALRASLLLLAEQEEQVLGTSRTATEAGAYLGGFAAATALFFFP